MCSSWMHLLGSFRFAYMFTVDQEGLDHLPGGLVPEEGWPLPLQSSIACNSSSRIACSSSSRGGVLHDVAIHWLSNSIVIVQGFGCLHSLFPGKSEAGSPAPSPCSLFPVLSCFSCLLLSLFCSSFLQLLQATYSHLKVQNWDPQIRRTIKDLSFWTLFYLIQYIF